MSVNGLQLGQCALCALLFPLMASAQRVNENPVTAAEDAFGTTVGSQTIGLYDAQNVRGFSPRQAGNLRIEGLYFDQQTYDADNCLVSGQTIRVGLAAQSFDFPAPTGIADYSLRLPGSGNLTSVVLSRGPFDASGLELDGHYGRTDQAVSMSLCFHRHLNSDFEYARTSQINDTGLIVRGRLPGNLDLIAFGGTTRGDEDNELPFVYTEGVEGIPTFRQMRLPTQDWTHWTWHDLTAGAILRTATTGAWSLAAGIFRSVRENPPNYNDLFLDLALDRTVIHQIDVTPPLTARSTSGEIRLAYRTGSDTRTSVWTMSVRGRTGSRTFGGDSITTYPGRVSIDDFTPLPQPSVSFTAGSKDRVQQIDLGASIDELWPGRGSVGAGVQKVKYQRSIDAPDAATAVDKTDPVLPTFRFTVSPAAKLQLYGSYTRGLEDSEIAPANAQNRGEAPPATPTWQVDVGARYAPRLGTQFLLGAFEVNKAYFNLNAAGVYTQLGQIRHRGLEASATINSGQGLVAVLGGVWLKAQVQGGSGDVVAAQGTPLGSVPLLLNADLDYAPPSWKPWSVSLAWTGTSARPATTNDTVQLPAYSQLSITVRYAFRVFGHPGEARLDANDVGDSDAMTIDPTGHVLSVRGRSFALTLTADL
jgi:iron complex outermembrane recepter protein